MTFSTLAKVILQKPPSFNSHTYQIPLKVPHLKMVIAYSHVLAGMLLVT